MQYKTITLELLQQHKGLAQYLRSQRQLLRAVERLAGQLRGRHLEIQADLQATHPGGDSSGICSLAMEMAIEELQIRMTEFSELPFDDPETDRQFAEMLNSPSSRE